MLYRRKIDNYWHAQVGVDSSSSSSAPLQRDVCSRHGKHVDILIILWGRLCIHVVGDEVSENSVGKKSST